MSRSHSWWCRSAGRWLLRQAILLSLISSQHTECVLQSDPVCYECDKSERSRLDSVWLVADMANWVTWHHTWFRWAEMNDMNVEHGSRETGTLISARETLSLVCNTVDQMSSRSCSTADTPPPAPAWIFMQPRRIGQWQLYGSLGLTITAYNEYAWTLSNTSKLSEKRWSLETPKMAPKLSINITIYNFNKYLFTTRKPNLIILVNITHNKGN